ncbi:hypothetical protein SERLA73DRAFT_181324 [Serpula lacrymans var. lacrymans S7.3]|uniref:Uncharacterized protein n=2 Tax=Serpula lacrymans var. lacrymans TaxID=341189 RepID=F8PXV2_SERL3|nr:uncharacterized protein SERLADRAFT_467416 [Serpula lacrymans var. lacrymans S7.9]EGN98715.1 hypothetical protein SERLA73DRAFT_181324 [Serpula lacrymans var. lacrymans S7.3]EGO24317.1 hypothetical protein SERLADRAFT_467416 [Serpula lacrymans var. lacrymans S7.9]
MATLTEDIRTVVVSSAFPKIFSAGGFEGLSSLDGHDSELATRGYVTRRHSLEFQRAILSQLMTYAATRPRKPRFLSRKWMLL